MDKKMPQSGIEEQCYELFDDSMLERFIHDTAIDALSKMSDETKRKFVEAPRHMHHFGIGLWIRNNYIHGKDLKFGVHPDALSSEIINKMIDIVNEGNGYDET